MEAGRLGNTKVKRPTEKTNPENPSPFSALHERYGNSLLILGRGAQGALMYVAADHRFYQAAAISPRPVINTVGAGDALFSAFIHGINQHQDPYRALRQACLFAGWKIGTPRAAEGFLHANELAQLAQQHGLN